jgi:hypothetical protein
MIAASTRSCVYRLVTFLLVLGAVAEAKLKPTTPSSAGIIPSRSVVDGYFIPKLPVPRRPFSALLVCAYMFFFRVASCFTGQSFVSCSLIMYRAWANVLLPPNPALKPQSDAHDIGRFGYLMNPPAAQLAGPAIEGRTKIGEHGIFESPMCDIPAGSGGLSAASENAIVVSPFPPRITVCLRTRG